MSMFEIVQAVFKANDLTALAQVNGDLLKRIEASNTRSVEDLLATMEDNRFSLARNFGSEFYVPSSARQQKKKCTAIR